MLQSLIMSEIFEHFIDYCIDDCQILLSKLLCVNREMHKFIIKHVNNVILNKIQDNDTFDEFMLHCVKNDFIFVLKKIDKKKFIFLHLAYSCSMWKEKVFSYFVESGIVDYMKENDPKLESIDHDLLLEALRYNCLNIIKYILKNRASRLNAHVIPELFHKATIYNRIDIIDCFLDTNCVQPHIITTVFNVNLNDGHTRVIKHLLKRGVIRKKTIHSVFRERIFNENSYSYIIELLVPYVTKNYIQICLNDLFSEDWEIAENKQYLVQIVLQKHPYLKEKIKSLAERNGVHFVYQAVFDNF